ncbi:MAG: GNAT family N-acetyltransferase [Acidimicrobiales bacterium]
MLQDVERRASEQFRDVGMEHIAEHEPASVEELGAYASDGRAWVATDEAGAPIGYVLVDLVDGHAHMEQVSVRPEHQGAGVGRELLARVRAWALEGGRDAITLTTFADVAWNRPLYEHLGFRVLADAEIGPDLAAVRLHEAELGLDPALRVCMRLDLTP